MIKYEKYLIQLIKKTENKPPKRKTTMLNVRIMMDKND